MCGDEDGADRLLTNVQTLYNCKLLLAVPIHQVFPTYLTICLIFCVIFSFLEYVLFCLKKIFFFFLTFFFKDCFVNYRLFCIYKCSCYFLFISFLLSIFLLSSFWKCSLVILFNMIVFVLYNHLIFSWFLYVYILFCLLQCYCEYTNGSTAHFFKFY